ncbi:MAG: ketol-acid reductoisomerase [Armatimonadetes bacterium]|nr:ketol-acid reductoisomerase [Armatimonadota bacterium]NIM23214.1 ketol-acid reductoisomerase [Armatimonadota bacterium]NIM67082.1 ketol-acid reductoisomerase [Armatimonadota bacterium]NIM75609.1 ketol-acid reductoisomerase [Armatimonadota bacterium]NIN05271.1 ketol-acid reductoisomerase [Armatimonadota bacterium]
MTRIYRDDEVDLSALAEKPIAIIGYGNQGRAQALNLRDSGLQVIVGGIPDESLAQAKSDGFEVMEVSAAASKGEVICLLVPDEVQKELFQDSILPNLKPGKALDFAHGYAIHYGLIVPPAEMDTILVAPRMIGAAVRELFQQGKGAPACIGVHQDASGQAWNKALALAKGIGATRGGAIHSSFAEETELDHFSEQVVWPAIFRVFIEAFELLVKEGYSPEVVALELWASGEPGEVMLKMAQLGLFKQMALHSRTSQYGTLTRTPTFLPAEIGERMRRSLNVIRSGEFAKEWEAEQAAGYPNFKRLRQQALAHPINAIEEKLKSLVKELE